MAAAVEQAWLAGLFQELKDDHLESFLEEVEVDEDLNLMTSIV